MFRSIKSLRRHRTARGCALVMLLLSVHVPASHGALTLSGTRVLFESDKRSVSLVVANPSDKPYAVQAWVNTSADDTTTAVPFAVSPPLFRVNPGKEQQLQINGLPNNLPTDRESLFFFNAQEIPQAEGEQSNVLNIAIRTRIKLFYRPAQLQDNPNLRLKDLQWSVQQICGKASLVVNNPTPFHYTFHRVQVSANGKTQTLATPPMVAPLDRQVYALDQVKPGPDLGVSFTTINDYGGITPAMNPSVQISR
ncbi:molecular chaperone [Pseudomonas sp. KK4]|uniref:fimbrial biogenesis chaperone n=1 Tax=Pseudomonas sp. KK4 TaxID=1855729 RepID=UPI00097C2A75|nr:molecular chaperone [Pseudomonas sp. KK4]